MLELGELFPCSSTTYSWCLQKTRKCLSIWSQGAHQRWLWGNFIDWCDPVPDYDQLAAMQFLSVSTKNASSAMQILQTAELLTSLVSQLPTKHVMRHDLWGRGKCQVSFLPSPNKATKLDQTPKCVFVACPGLRWWLALADFSKYLGTETGPRVSGCWTLSGTCLNRTKKFYAGLATCQIWIWGNQHQFHHCFMPPIWAGGSKTKMRSM